MAIYRPDPDNPRIGDEVESQGDTPVRGVVVGVPKEYPGFVRVRWNMARETTMEQIEDVTPLVHIYNDIVGR